MTTFARGGGGEVKVEYVDYTGFKTYEKGTTYIVGNFYEGRSSNGNAFGTVVDSKNRLVVAGGGILPIEVWGLNINGIKLDSPLAPTQCLSMALTAAKNVIIPALAKPLVLKPDLTLTEFPSYNNTGGPSHAFITSSGFVIYNIGSKEVSKYTENGVKTDWAKMTASTPIVGTSNLRNQYVADAANGNTYRYNTSGIVTNITGVGFSAFAGAKCVGNGSGGVVFILQNSWVVEYSSSDVRTQYGFGYMVQLFGAAETKDGAVVVLGYDNRTGTQSNQAYLIKYGSISPLFKTNVKKYSPSVCAAEDRIFIAGGDIVSYYDPTNIIEMNVIGNSFAEMKIPKGSMYKLNDTVERIATGENIKIDMSDGKLSGYIKYKKGEITNE